MNDYNNNNSNSSSNSTNNNNSNNQLSCFPYNTTTKRYILISKLNNNLPISPSDYEDNAICKNCKYDNNPNNLHFIVSDLSYICEKCNIILMRSEKPFFGYDI